MNYDIKTMGQPLFRRNGLANMVGNATKPCNPTMETKSIWDEQHKKEFSAKVRNLMAKIHAQCTSLNNDIMGFQSLFDGLTDVSMDEVLTAYYKSMMKANRIGKELSTEIDSAEKKISRMFNSDKRKSEENAMSNFSIIDHIHHIAMDCDHRGGFNNTGKILVEMPESLFNTLKLPKYALNQMLVYGSVLDREELDKW